MAISRVQVTSGTTGNTFPTSLATSAFGSPTTVGNYIIVAALADGLAKVQALTMSDSKGNLYYPLARANINNTGQVDIWIAPIKSGGSSHTVTVGNLANTTAAIIAEELVGKNILLDVSVTATDNTGTSIAISSGTSASTTDINTYIWVAAFSASSTATVTVGATYSNLTTVTSNPSKLSIESKAVAAFGTQVGTMALSAGASWGAALVALKEGGPSVTVVNFNPGRSWKNRFTRPGYHNQPTWYTQGIDDIPQQMNVSTFLPGQAWVQRFGKNERRIFLPAISSFVSWLQNLADSVASSDSVVKNPTLNKSDSVTSSDSPVKNVALSKSDTVTSSESISNRPTLNKTDSVTSSDTIVKNVSKALSDSVTSSESISKAPTKKLADSVTSSDAITTFAVVKHLTDSVTLVETLLLVDGNLTEVVGPPNAFTFHINDSTTSSDLITTTTVYKRSLADTVTAAESISNQPTKKLSDSATSSESIAKIPTLNKSDSVTTTDATVKAVVLHKTDTATSSDNISNQPTKKLSDSAVVSDSLLKSLVKSLADSVTASDALAKAIGLNKTDSVTVAEAISNRFTKNLTDTVVSSDLSLRYLNGVLVTGSTSTLTNSIITTNGEVVLRLAGQEQQFIRLLDGRWVLRVGAKLYMTL